MALPSRLLKLVQGASGKKIGTKCNKGAFYVLPDGLELDRFHPEMFSLERVSSRLLGIPTIKHRMRPQSVVEATREVMSTPPLLWRSLGDVDARSLTDDIVAARAETRRQWHTRTMMLDERLQTSGGLS